MSTLANTEKKFSSQEQQATERISAVIEIAKRIYKANVCLSTHSELIKLYGGHASPKELAIYAARKVMSGHSLSFKY